MKNNQLSSEAINSLRAKNLLSENEFAYQAGDLIVAENPVTGEKRIIGNTEIMIESSKRVLKG